MSMLIDILFIDYVVDKINPTDCGEGGSVLNSYSKLLYIYIFFIIYSFFILIQIVTHLCSDSLHGYNRLEMYWLIFLDFCGRACYDSLHGLDTYLEEGSGEKRRVYSV